MMKKIGFKAHVAAAVEAAASTGGLIMPPVMASVGFLMAEYTGIPYARIMKLIVLPAVLYFLSVGIMVHIYSVKEKIPTIPKEDLPDLKKIVKGRGYLALPLIILNLSPGGRLQPGLCGPSGASAGFLSSVGSGRLCRSSSP